MLSTPDQFINLLIQYNRQIWPMQVVAYAAGLVSILLILRPMRFSSPVVSCILAVFWLWTGAAFFWMQIGDYTKTGYIMAVLFVLQGGLLWMEGFITRRLSFRLKSNGYALAGALIVMYGAAIAPLISDLAGQTFPGSPSFGVTPASVIIFTLGLLLWNDQKNPKSLLIIPALASIVCWLGAIKYRITEDYLLLPLSIIALVILLLRDRRIKEEAGSD